MDAPPSGERRRIFALLGGVSVAQSAQAAMAQLTKADGPPGSAALWGFRQPISDALTRMAAGKLAERVSWLDFLPYGRHSAILDHRDQTDWAERLQAMLDALPAGARLYVPGRVNIERGLIGRRSITLYGDAGRENFDNSWDRATGGSQILFRGEAGDVITFSASEDDNANMNVVLRDLIIRGNRLRDDGQENASARSGAGLVLVGGRGHTTNLRVDIDNVHVAQPVDEGVLLQRTVFGGSLRNMFIHRSGRTGFRTTPAGGIGIGEMWLARIRLFQNGARGRNDMDSAGLVWSGGSFLASQLSSTNNAGPGIVISGGPFEINQLQVESNGQAIRQQGRQRQVVIGDGRTGTVAGRISTLMSAPDDGYEGVHIELGPDAKNIVLDGFLGGQIGARGCHILRRERSEGLDVSRLRGCTTVIDQSRDHSTRMDCRLFARQEAPLTSVTGDGSIFVWRPENVAVGPAIGRYDPRTGTFEAGINGLYSVVLSIPLRGIAPEHRSCTVQAAATSYGRTTAMGNIGSLRQGTDGRYTVSLSETFPLRQGERVAFHLSVGGGPRSVGVEGQQGYLSLFSV